VWEVRFDDEFLAELHLEPAGIRKQVAKLAQLLAAEGPQLSRPYCDTLKGSRFTNMKELRFSEQNAVWRIAFAFDPERRAILLVGGDKSGVSQRRFYRTLIQRADERFQRHLDATREGR
jgi:hypothetical protein